ncbi:MAG TPA: hypothetical protein VF715_14545 [Thermoleophilaceae bacterium]
MALGLRDIVTLPIRIGEQAGRMAIGPIMDVTGRVIEVAEGLLGRNGHDHAAAPERAEPSTAAEAAAPAATTDPDTPAASPAAVTPPADPTPVEEGAAFTTADPTDISSPPPIVADAPEIGVVEAAGSAPVPPSEIDEPVHVSEEPVLVAESADVEIADGIHTDLHVQEPWDGYRQQTAHEVIEALERCNPAQLAVVRLYESTHRARKTVLEAADRELARR